MPHTPTSPNDTARIVLITGCSSGIGAATARLLQQEGWQVYATARHLEPLEPLARMGCRTLRLDVTDEASMQAAVERIHAEAGGIGVLINNAGYSQSGPIEDVPIAAIRRQFETNVFGLLRLTQLVLPDMRARRQGRIVNIGSMGGRLTFPGGGLYHATKYALEALSDALRFEVRGFGIHVILIQPGLIRTAFTTTVSAQLDPVRRDRGPYARFTREVERITRESYVEGPVARWAGGPDDVARVIATALRAREPKARYKVTASARLFMTVRALVPDSVWDGLMARTYPRPGVSNDSRRR